MTRQPSTDALTIPGFRPVPRTGVIFVMSRAARAGFRRGDDAWLNLGQGSPETGDLPGAPDRVRDLHLTDALQAYAPVDGLVELRERVAAFYNHFYRQGKSSQYTAENVSIGTGGRASMTRVAAAMGEVNLGHFIPDYTAYEELLGTFKGFIPIPILLDAEHRYRASSRLLRKEIVGRGLGALLCSNPCNPTGQVISGDELEAWIQLARQERCTLILDEFYSHYIFREDDDEEAAQMVSAAEFVDDVNRDPVVLVDGLTKNWRYPGWRVSWTVGPRDVIEQITSAGSFLDGGGCQPFQEAAIPLLDPAHVIQETSAIQRSFRTKREYLIGRLRDLGIQVEVEPEGSFYVWADLSQLPPPLNDGLQFFQEGLSEKIITVPGVFFDVNPGKRRSNARYQSYCRFSFGPQLAKIERGLDAVERMIERVGSRH